MTVQLSWMELAVRFMKAAKAYKILVFLSPDDTAPMQITSQNWKPPKKKEAA